MRWKTMIFSGGFHRLPVLPAWPNIKEDLRTPWVSWLWANIMSLLSRGWGESPFTLSLEGFLGHCRYLTGLSAFSVYCASDIDVSAAEVSSELNPPEPPALNGTQIWGRGQSPKAQRRKKWKQTWENFFLLLSILLFLKRILNSFSAYNRNLKACDSLSRRCADDGAMRWKMR